MSAHGMPTCDHIFVEEASPFVPVSSGRPGREIRLMGDTLVSNVDDEFSSGPSASRSKVGVRVAGSLMLVVVVGLVGMSMLSHSTPLGNALGSDKQPTAVIMRNDDPDAPLFDRLGGTYAVAAVVSRFIDTIMVDKILNANPRTQKAHHAIEPAGFKYLVWECVANATGGPVIYTGRDLKTAHWHLKITNKEWAAFAADFQDVLDYFKVPAKLQKELFAVLGSTKPLVVNESKDPVSKPPPPDANADPKSLYKRLGGVYPIAGVVDHAIDLTLVEPKLNQNPKIKEKQETLLPDGFKVLVTQYLGMLFDGPQVYMGKPLSTVHKPLNISDFEWQANTEAWSDVMTYLYKIPASLQKEVGEKIENVKPRIVCEN